MNPEENQKKVYFDIGLAAIFDYYGLPRNQWKVLSISIIIFAIFSFMSILIFGQFDSISGRLIAAFFYTVGLCGLTTLLGWGILVFINNNASDKFWSDMRQNLFSRKNFVRKEVDAPSPLASENK